MEIYRKDVYFVTVTPVSLYYFPSKNAGVACHFLLQVITLTQRSNPHYFILCSDRKKSGHAK